MKTLLAPQKPRMDRTWYVIDADGQTLGRIATKISRYLMGKDRPNYTPHLDNGDYVIVINADKIVTTGNKETQKMYRSHSGFMGGLKELPLKEVRLKSPTTPLSNAVEGMLPKNNLRRHMLDRLRVVVGPKHDYEAQKPLTLSI